MIQIPSKVQIGGQELIVECPDKIEGGKLGSCCLFAGYIKIAKTSEGLDQTPSSMLNTYWHEVVHGILDTMGREDLSQNEAFVSTFAGFLTEAIKSMEYGEK